MANQQVERTPMSQGGAQGGGHLSESKLLEALKKNPKNLQALSALADLYMQQNNLYAALPLLQRAVQIAPSSARLNILGAVYYKLGKHDLAHPLLEKAIALDGNNGSALFNYAMLLDTLGKTEKALEFLSLAGEKVARLRIPAIATSATFKERMGRVDEAFADILSLVEQGHRTSPVLRAFGKILNEQTKFSAHIDAGISLLEGALEEKLIEPHEINSFYFLLGGLYQKKKNYDAAFHCFEQGHQYSNRIYHEETEVAAFIRVCQAWEETTAALPQNDPSRQQFFFIVGMPRSGSTLVEQILAVHSGATSVGESSYFTRAIVELFKSIREPHSSSGGRPLSADEVITIRSLYMQQAFKSHRPAAVITDKTLSNTYHVGQILQVFPNAKIIWTRRDPRDACLSCYTFDFAGPHAYRHDLKTLARYHNRTEALMRFWHERYPENVYALDYEEMIGHPEESIRKLIDFCGLPWSDDYLNFHQVKRNVSTASYNQVTQPIYNSAVGRWKVYEKHLNPLLEELDLQGR